MTVTIAVDGMVVNQAAILKGENVTLNAIATPPITPHYYVRWLFTASGSSDDDAVVINQSSLPHYSLSENDLSLHASDVDLTSRGNYTILVTNSLYMTKATVFLDVLCKCFRLCHK